MEEKRRDSIGTPPPDATVTQSKPPEAPPSEQPIPRRRGGGHKRKSASINIGGGSTTQAISSKRQAREKPAPVPFPLIHHNGPFTRARVQPNNNGLSAVEPTERIGVDMSVKTEESSEVNENWEALEAKIEAEYKAIRSRDANVHVVPIHAGWFSWTKIHALEERMLPSFFNGKSERRSPEIYMELRNSIIKEFHSNPNAQIELKDLAELTVGELDARQEVMEFLDYWGLINYHPFSHNGSDTVGPDSDAIASANPNEPGKTDSLVEKLFRFETEQSRTPVVPRINLATPAMSSGLFPESVVADELAKSEGPEVEYHCNSCSADCSRRRYHCQKQADFDLCADCFNNGKFGSDMSPSDFILMEPAEAGGASGGKWTDQETLLLLEAIEIFRDNWSEIAEHVATKTKAQCILHFVQMPIEDEFFNHDDETDATPKENGCPVSSNTDTSASKIDQNEDSAPKDVTEKTGSPGDANDDQASCRPMEISKPDEEDNKSDVNPEDGESCALKALREAFEVVGSHPSPIERLSFAEAGNPVMTIAAFLARLVEPNIAAASVRSSLKSLSGNSSSEQLAARHCFCLEDPPDNNKNSVDSEGAAAETIGLEGQKDEDLHAEMQKVEKSDPVVGEISSQNDENENENKGPATEELKLVESPSNEHADKSSDTGKEPEGMVNQEEAQTAPVGESSIPDLPDEPSQKNAEESAISTSKVELPPNAAKESGNGASTGDTSQSKDPPKDGDKLSNSGKEETEQLVAPNLMTEKEENTGVEEANECGNDKREPSVKEAKACDNKNKENSVIEDDLPIDKLKRAAVTALSAAAVKAKLLVDEEEDHIRELAAFLIEKQLHKLETKLAFFGDVENVAMRVKEQLDRSKQRLLHERAQIIATRLGISASSARPMSQSLPANRVGMTVPNPVSRNFMGMSSLRPPISRPMMTSNPTSSSFTPTAMAGSSVQINPDKLSSVGMK
ncbi:SWI/SNF complex subunit SWI3D [Abeliophyllum distichum]|uniref:SWI/SNF complex subunit SWI3D n=1 Tax=Abeliophyllum distichum TaxID=126358 RepID=A0ABD1P8F8_9LAMI